MCFSRLWLLAFFFSLAAGGVGCSGNEAAPHPISVPPDAATEGGSKGEGGVDAGSDANDGSTEDAADGADTGAEDSGDSGHEAGPAEGGAG